ncbi:MAG: Holliday junction resolvase RuvX [Alphaproteobacteria bacterium]|nr:Holliday junction resolvase RuvX [Alphaproteobacteria bacterium]
MIIMDENLQQFVNSLPKYSTIVGLDIGDVRIGVAVSDTLWSLSTALKTLNVQQDFEKEMEELKKMLEGRNIGGFVSGLPLEMNGNEGERAVKTKKIANKIASYFNKPIYFWDERLSSKAVERTLVDNYNFSRKKQKKNIDNGAAAFILQGFLDRIS